MNKVVKILMERDEITETQAIQRIDACRKAMLKATDKGAYDRAEDILMDRLGLEMDYIYDII
jgi:hypothetical protein